MDEAIRVESLKKYYGKFAAVDDISFNVQSGEIFGILGPNGAGKTTTLEILEGLHSPNDGSVTVLNLDVLKHPKEIKSRIGVQLQSSAYYDYLNLLEILTLLASFYPPNVRANPTEILRKVDLENKSRQRVNTLSGGEKQRFTIAASLINNPELLILDEPTTGLDPRSRRNIWQLIEGINQSGITVVLTTHYMDEAEALCRRIAIMDNGHLIAVDTPANLRASLEYQHAVKLTVETPLTEAQIVSLNNLDADIETKSENTYAIKLKGGTASLDLLLKSIVADNVKFQNLEITPVTLEDVFLDLTGNELQEAP
ncbi:MAG: ABC transporter [Dehalococcoidia bacterium]|nr:ABC transporter [Dehalococcoidia bacterium]